MSGTRAGVTYDAVGMTKGAAAPEGFRALTVRTRLGGGAYEDAVRVLSGWGMHRGTPGMRVPVGTPAAALGVRVELRWGPVRAPCEVVWTVAEPDRAGFAYGTLPGHPECGEESFVIRRLPDGAAELTVRAYSRPAAWWLRTAGPFGRCGQRAMAHLYGRALRRACGGG
ncbi:DUF1990 family protein [Actinacidiphila sp. bgisy145]|uniref:DUF1990 family protein n=1 Tax=Actinacidiphila sp. bgisy145 TaxID=3413792 RepID=UPI003EBC44C7